MSDTPARDRPPVRQQKALRLRRSSKPHREQDAVLAGVYHLLCPQPQIVLGVGGALSSAAPAVSSPLARFAGAS